jgi:hypothetical protein
MDHRADLRQDTVAQACESPHRGSVKDVRDGEVHRDRLGRGENAKVLLGAEIALDVQSVGRVGAGRVDDENHRHGLNQPRCQIAARKPERKRRRSRTDRQSIGRLELDDDLALLHLAVPVERRRSYAVAFAASVMACPRRVRFLSTMICRFVNPRRLPGSPTIFWPLGSASPRWSAFPSIRVTPGSTSSRPRMCTG